MSVVGIILAILAILLFLVLLLLVIPLGILVSYHGDFNELLLKIRVGFIHFNLKLPTSKVKKDAEKDVKKTIEVAQEVAIDEVEHKPAVALEKIKKYLPLISLVPPTIYRLIEGIKIDRVVIIWYVHSKNAADSAINAGRMYSMFYSLFAAVTPPFNIKLKQVLFEPDYIGEAGVNNLITVRVSTQLISIVAVALWFFIEMKSDMKSSKRRVRKERNTV